MKKKTAENATLLFSHSFFEEQDSLVFSSLPLFTQLPNNNLVKLLCGLWTQNFPFDLPKNSSTRS